MVLISWQFSMGPERQSYIYSNMLGYIDGSSIDDAMIEGDDSAYLVGFYKTGGVCFLYKN